MAAAVERLGTLVPITPGGAGIAEIGAVAWLVGSGLDPVQAVAGVLLYRVFVFALEIPVGGVLLGGWAWWERAADPDRDRGGDVRVLHVSDHYPPVLGGIERHVAALAERQACRGHDVAVVTSGRATADGRHGDDTGAVEVHRVRSRRDVSAAELASYDVLHAHVSVVAPFTAPLVAAAARRGVPTIVTVHSLWSRMGPLPTAAARWPGCAPPRCAGPRSAGWPPTTSPPAAGRHRGRGAAERGGGGGREPAPWRRCRVIPCGW